MNREDDIITWTDFRRWFLMSTAAGLLAGGTIGWLGRSPAEGNRKAGEACARPPSLPNTMTLREATLPRPEGFTMKMGGNQ